MEMFRHDQSATIVLKIFFPVMPAETLSSHARARPICGREQSGNHFLG
jgi:hypothetical protein